MEIICNTTDFYLERPTAVAIGKFDGVHVGHRRLLEEIIAQKEKGLAACVFTFEPAPAVLFGLSDGKELTTREEKRRLFERMGVDILIEFPLTLESAAITPECFVKSILVNRMSMEFIAAGRDLSFGCGGAGNAALLEQMAPESGYTTKIIDKIIIQGTEVSSTFIRSLIEESKMTEAEKFLGMPYTIVGKVVYGNQIGRTIGFPTVNLLPPASKLLPQNGVYYSRVSGLGRQYHAITNIGYKPTVTAERVMGVESYLYDFSADIYEEEIEVALYEFRRPEQRFADLEGLKKQLQEDIVAGREWWA